MPAPFLPPKKEGDPKYSLVLDMDETLVHVTFKDDGEINFSTRPYLDKFLTDLSKDYELSVFTTAKENYANSILDEIDDKHLIKHRLYRNHTVQDDSDHLTKDMTKIGRDIKKSIIIDDKAKNFSKTPENGI